MAAAAKHRRGGSLSLCLASAGVVKALSVAAFTLVWTHSVEKVEWQEDWRVTPNGLVLAQARVKGSGAGIGAPPGARLIDGWVLSEAARRQGPRRRQGAAAGGASHRWLVSMAAAARADAAGGAGQFRRRRRMAAVP